MPVLFLNFVQLSFAVLLLPFVSFPRFSVLSASIRIIWAALEEAVPANTTQGEPPEEALAPFLSWTQLTGAGDSRGTAAAAAVAAPSCNGVFLVSIVAMVISSVTAILLSQGLWTGVLWQRVKYTNRIRR